MGGARNREDIVEQRTLIITQYETGGFFSKLNCALANLDFYLGKNGVIAASVIWCTQQADEDFYFGRSGVGNAWLHFFEPLSFPEFPSTHLDVAGFPISRSGHLGGKSAYVTYKFNRRWRSRYHELYQKFVTLRPFLSERADSIFRTRMSDRFCVGVHYRNPRHSHECPWQIPSPEIFIARAKQLLPAGRPAAVVLASDYEPAVEAFRAAFGDALIIQPEVVRAASSSQDQMHHLHANWSLTLGEQVLVDCLLLSKCDVLLHVVSNVATAAAYINPKLKLVYCETFIASLYGYLWAALRSAYLLLRFEFHFPTLERWIEQKLRQAKRTLRRRPNSSRG